MAKDKMVVFSTKAYRTSDGVIHQSIGAASIVERRLALRRLIEDIGIKGYSEIDIADTIFEHRGALLAIFKDPVTEREDE